MLNVVEIVARQSDDGDVRERWREKTDDLGVLLTIREAVKTSNHVSGVIREGSSSRVTGTHPDSHVIRHEGCDEE